MKLVKFKMEFGYTIHLDAEKVVAIDQQLDNSTNIYLSVGDNIVVFNVDEQHDTVVKRLQDVE